MDEEMTLESLHELIEQDLQSPSDTMGWVLNNQRFLIKLGGEFEAQQSQGSPTRGNPEPPPPATKDPRPPRQTPPELPRATPPTKNETAGERPQETQGGENPRKQGPETPIPGGPSQGGKAGTRKLRSPNPFSLWAPTLADYGVQCPEPSETDDGLFYLKTDNQFLTHMRDCTYELISNSSSLTAIISKGEDGIITFCELGENGCLLEEEMPIEFLDYIFYLVCGFVIREGYDPQDLCLWGDDIGENAEVCWELPGPMALHSMCQLGSYDTMCDAIARSEMLSPWWMLSISKRPETRRPIEFLSRESLELRSEDNPITAHAKTTTAPKLSDSARNTIKTKGPNPKKPPEKKTRAQDAQPPRGHSSILDPVTFTKGIMGSIKLEGDYDSNLKTLVAQAEKSPNSCTVQTLTLINNILGAYNRLIYKGQASHQQGQLDQILDNQHKILMEVRNLHSTKQPEPPKSDVSVHSSAEVPPTLAPENPTRLRMIEGLRLQFGGGKPKKVGEELKAKLLCLGDMQLKDMITRLSRASTKEEAKRISGEITFQQRSDY